MTKLILVLIGIIIGWNLLAAIIYYMEGKLVITKKPVKVLFYDPPTEAIIQEFCRMSSGKIVVMLEKHEGFPESFWFYPDGTNPKSRLVFEESNL